MAALIEHYPFVLAFLLGLVPAIVWLWFWLKEDIHHEPSRMIALSFLGGMIAVIIALLIEENVYVYIKSKQNLAFFVWALIEELSKFILIYWIALRNKIITDEPIDDIIYLKIGAIGFTTLENTLYLVEPLRSGDIISTLIGLNLRFIGASLLHIISSSVIGTFLALSYYGTKIKRKFYGFIGVVLAVLLHTAFNLFIINQSNKPGQNIFFLFGTVWLGVVILLLLFEKIKRITWKNI